MENQQIRVKDVDEAAFFLTLKDKFTLLGVDTSKVGEKTKVWFCFQTILTDDELRTLQDDFRNGRCTVEPKTFTSRRLEVKSIIHDICFHSDNSRYARRDLNGGESPQA